MSSTFNPFSGSHLEQHKQDSKTLQPSNALQSPSPKRLVVLCDGTWQMRRSVHSIRTRAGVQTASGTRWFTNVALLGQCISATSSPLCTVKRSNPDADDGVPFPHDAYVMPQITFYQNGIGSTPYFLPRMLEGATGSSLDLKVQEAYLFIVDNFNHGDEICLFGFSRGAYTARTLAALINYVGVLSRQESSMYLAKIWQAFRHRDPSKPQSVLRAERTVFECLGRWPSRNAMYTAKANVRAVKELFGGIASEDRKREKGKKEISLDDGFVQSSSLDIDKRTPAIVPPTIQVVGVWDTVGALGVPGSFLNPKSVQFFSFFDPMLAPNVRHAFHALALHEDRKDFLPTIWALPKHELPEDAERRRRQVLKQCWFQGSHTDIGGGYHWHGLSDITLAWMIGQLMDNKQRQLLNIDVHMARRMQDFRLPWARQPQHPSRMAIEFQRTRHVRGWSVPPAVDRHAVWHDVVDRKATHESLHHSVTVGGQYDPHTSKQFLRLRNSLNYTPSSIVDAAEEANANTQDETRRDSDATAVEPTLSSFDNINVMWNAAKDPNSLTATEQQLRWTERETNAFNRHLRSTRPDKEPGLVRDQRLAATRPDRIGERVWHAFVTACYAPMVVTSMACNVLRNEPLDDVCADTISPPWPLRILQRLDKRPQEPSEPRFL